MQGQRQMVESPEAEREEGKRAVVHGGPSKHYSLFPALLISLHDFSIPSAVEYLYLTNVVQLDQNL